MKDIRFETKRLLIRDMSMSDCDIVANIWGSPEVGKYLSDPYYKNGDELRASFPKGLLDNHLDWNDDFYLIAIDKSTEELIGTACTWVIENDIWGIGYTIKYGNWNEGLGTELVEGLEMFVKKNGGKCLSAEIAEDNIGSLKVCYKNGFSNYLNKTFKKADTNIIFGAWELRKDIRS